MTESIPDRRPLAKALLATDMSARGDRALERALSIVADRDAHLVIVHVFEELEESTQSYIGHAAPSWRRPPDAAQMARLRIAQGLRADLGGAVEKATVLIGEGEPAEVIERVATSENVDVVVTGIARERLFASRPVILGKTVEQLLRRLQTPVLIVRNRARTPYQHIVVATDFSKASAHALEVALRFFPSRTLHLLHASVTPYVSRVSDPERHAEGFKEVLATDMEAFLAAIPFSESDRQRVMPSIEPGAPAQIVREYVQVHGADLVVVGTHGRGAVLEALIGSTAKSILASLPCDVLVVRRPSR
jgi:nucleotide-binding universal stress UspA family protein